MTRTLFLMSAESLTDSARKSWADGSHVINIMTAEHECYRWSSAFPYSSVEIVKENNATCHCVDRQK